MSTTITSITTYFLFRLYKILLLFLISAFAYTTMAQAAAPAQIPTQSTTTTTTSPTAPAANPDPMRPLTLDMPTATIPQGYPGFDSRTSQSNVNAPGAAAIDYNTQLRSRINVGNGLTTPSQNVNLSNINGTFTLQGTVATEEERRRIEQMARDLSPGTTIESQLQVIQR